MAAPSSNGTSSPTAQALTPPALANTDEHGPLSWEEARCILRKSLEKYLDDDSPPLKIPSRQTTTTTTPTPTTTAPASSSGATSSEAQDSHDDSCASSCLSNWIRLDLDLYLGAVLLSVALLVIASCSFHWSRTDPDDESTAAVRRGMDRAQLAGAVLLTVGALSGVWVVRRRRFLCVHDSNVARRREVRKFLRATATATTITGNNNNNNNSDPSLISPLCQSTTSPDKATTSRTRRAVPEISNLTAQTGVYPVYRRRGDKCFWSRIPSLLLVQGDWIALQIGDVGPAHCRLLHSDNNTNNNEAPMHVHVGERLTVDHFAPTTDQLTASLPRGRKTLSVQDDTVEAQNHFLTMCNNMHLFVIVESPMEHFLRRQSVVGPPSQISRQLRAIREILFVLSLIFLLLTAAIGLGRLGGSSDGMDDSSNNNDDSSTSSTTTSTTDRALDVVYMPILAALGVLPVVAPAFLFFLEVCGTSRILTTVHAYSNMADRHIKSSKSSNSSACSHDSHTSSVKRKENVEASGNARLLLRYILATSLTRLSLWFLYDLCSRFLQSICFSSHADRSPPSRVKLVRVPPASVNLLEKLGVATTFTLVDDELACEPQSIPQQLLIPSGKGLKLLDLCPAYESNSSDDEKSTDSSSMAARRARGKSLDDSDSESDEGRRPNNSNIKRGGGMLRRKMLLKRMRRRRSELLRSVRSEDDETQETLTGGIRFDVQFEDPNWWQFLPSLKCIGLACLMHEEQKKTEVAEDEVSSSAGDHDFLASSMNSTSATDSAVKQAGARSALVKLVCHERQSRQLRSLAECIGFSTQENIFGSRGDITPFVERLRLHILSNQLYKDRLALDTHERSSEQSRWWGLIRADSTSVVIEDIRTKAFQLLTVGDPVIVTKLCNEAWQGEISTILPLAASDRRTIIDTTNNWKLADLDVAAFSYTPVPRTLETRLSAEHGSHLYLLDHADPQSMILKDKLVSPEWSFVKNQVFLGVLGSLIVPRLLLKRMIDVLTVAGVRFVYFSPRNMRRQKELAIQLGLDVSWNCAISLRSLQSGEEDPHRMDSTYGDWDVNAKLPHGVEAVRKHLRDVDNVPLLVSLFTDVTKATTKEMIEIFQDYNDTVVTVGISHLTRNYCIFASADIAVGIDILDTDSATFDGKRSYVLPAELEFANAISAHACAFRFRGPSSIAHIPFIIQKGRESLEASVAASVFLMTGCLSFSFYILFTVCSPLVSIPFVPTLGCVIYLQLFLPTLGLSMAMTAGDKETMKRVPPKNDKSLTFGWKEKSTFYSMVAAKALLPALLPQILHLISFGELVLDFEPDLVDEKCPGADNWVKIVRCEGLRDYSGPAKSSAGSLVFSQFGLCIFFSSAGFVNRCLPILEGKPWHSNTCWLICNVVVIGLLALYVGLATEDGTAAALPWYYYLIAVVTPFLCLIVVEICKRPEIKQEKRAEKLRRLQFETRLGAWSPR